MHTSSLPNPGVAIGIAVAYLHSFFPSYCFLYQAILNAFEYLMLKQLYYLPHWIYLKRMRHLFHVVMTCHFTRLISKVLTALYISKFNIFYIFPSSLSTINLMYALGKQQQWSHLNPYWTQKGYFSVRK